MAENIEIVVLILKIEFYTIFPKPTSFSKNLRNWVLVKVPRDAQRVPGWHIGGALS
jgi:hypothetical protein